MDAKEKRRVVKEERRSIRREIRRMIDDLYLLDHPGRPKPTPEQVIEKVAWALRAIENHLYSLDTGRTLGETTGREAS